MCEGLDRDAVPSLFFLHLAVNNFGPAGAEAFAAALGRGAMPKLEHLSVGGNPIGRQGLTAPLGPTRKHPALAYLYLSSCNLGDDDVAYLVADPARTTSRNSSTSISRAINTKSRTRAALRSRRLWISALSPPSKLFRFRWAQLASRRRRRCSTHSSARRSAARREEQSSVANSQSREHPQHVRGSVRLCCLAKVPRSMEDSKPLRFQHDTHSICNRAALTQRPVSCKGSETVSD